MKYIERRELECRGAVDPAPSEPVEGTLLVGEKAVLEFSANQSQYGEDDVSIFPAFHNRERCWLTGDDSFLRGDKIMLTKEQVKAQLIEALLTGTMDLAPFRALWKQLLAAERSLSPHEHELQVFVEEVLLAIALTYRSRNLTASIHTSPLAQFCLKEGERDSWEK